MCKACKLILVMVLTIAVLAVLALSAQATPQCRPAKIALATPCFQSQMAPFMAAHMFDVRTEVTPMGGGMMDVGFYLVPKCLNDPIPCRIATQYVGGVVDCNTRTAVCD